MTRLETGGCRHCGTGCEWKPERETRVEVEVMVKTERRMKIMTVTEDYISRVYPKDNNIVDMSEENNKDSGRIVDDILANVKIILKDAYKLWDTFPLQSWQSRSPMRSVILQGTVN